MDCQVQKNKRFQYLLLFTFNECSKTLKATRYIFAKKEDGFSSQNEKWCMYVNPFRGTT